jgi:hypothetical protein
MAHRELPEEDIDLPLTRTIVKEETRTSLKGIELTVRRIARASQQIAQGPGGSAWGGEIDVLKLAGQFRPPHYRATAQKDRDATQ